MMILLLVLALSVGVSLVLPGSEVARISVGVWFLILPGWGWQSWILRDRESSPILRLSLALISAWSIQSIFGIPFGWLGLAPWTAALPMVLGGLGLLLRPTRTHSTAPRNGRSGEDIWIAIVSAIFAILIMVAPLHLNPNSDIFAHVAAIRACLEEQRIFPIHEFYTAAQGTGADPRFGLIHSALSVWAQLSHSTPLQVWKSSAIFSLPLFVFGTGLLAKVTTKSFASFLIAHIAFLGSYGGSIYNPLAISNYPLWIGVSSLFVMMSLLLRTSPRDLRNRRIIALCAFVLLGIGGVHVLPYILGCGILISYALFSSNRDLKSMVPSVATMIALTTPFMVMRIFTSYGNVNPIHQRPWNMMTWGPGLYSASPSYLLQWLFPIGALGILFGLMFWKNIRADRAQRFIMLLAISALLWMILPFTLGPSVKVLGFLPLRFPFLVLFPLPLAYSYDLLRQRYPGLGRFLVTPIVALLLLVPLAHRVKQVYSSSSIASVQDAPWTTLTTVCADSSKNTPVVLSDPFTMLALRATSPVSIVAVPNGRSSPRDPNALIRLRDCWLALSPQTDGPTTDSILDKYGIDRIVLNTSYTTNLYSYEYAVSCSTFDDQLTKLNDNPQRFTQLWHDNGFALYAVVRGQRITNQSYLTNCLQSLAKPTAKINKVPLAEHFFISNLTLARRLQSGKDYLFINGSLGWDGDGSAPDRFFVIRADRDPGPIPTSLRPFEKPLRKALEILTGTPYRYRWSIYSHHGECPTYLLSRNTLIPVQFTIPRPRGMKPGRYRVTLQVSDRSVFTLLRPRDFLRDSDVYSGVEAGVLHID